MRIINTKAYAKINISLDVSKRRDDGYHDILTIMQTVSLFDELTITVTDGEFNSRSNMGFIPNDDRNLAIKAAKTFFEAADIKNAGADITMKKRIPVGAGMAGGSADAAAVLRGLNQLYGTIFTVKQLEDLGAKVGSDVPFCVSGGTQLAKGRGEILSPLPHLPDCNITICKPSFSISTPELFKKLDSIDVRCRPDTNGIIDCLENQDLMGICRRMYNVFEDIPDRRMKEIRSIRNSMLDHGALGSIMTGSGSAVFGIFNNVDDASKACSALSNSRNTCYIVRNIASLTQ